MTSTQWEHQDEVRDALRTIVSDPQLGVPALSNSQTMSNLLKDLLPDAPRETSVLVAAAEAGLPQVLRDHVAQGMDVATASSLTASSFAARTPFTPDACTWVVGELAVALGLAPAGGAGEPAPARALPLRARRPARERPLRRPSAPPWARAGSAGSRSQGSAGSRSQDSPGSRSQDSPGSRSQDSPGSRATAASRSPRPPTSRRAGPVPSKPSSGSQWAPTAGRPWFPRRPLDAARWRGAGGHKRGRAGTGKRVPKFWGFLVAGLVAVAVIAGIVVALQHHSSTPVEAVSKIIRPDVVTCKSRSVSMAGATAFDCSTHVSTIGMSAYQFDNNTDYRAGLSRVNSFTGFSSSLAGSGCPPPAGKTEGQIGWHTIANPKYRRQLPGQILECYAPAHATSKLLYLWTLPSQRVVLVGGDFSANASFTDLQNWWKNLTYG